MELDASPIPQLIYIDEVGFNLAKMKRRGGTSLVNMAS
jgi:hypothetical protein